MSGVGRGGVATRTDYGGEVGTINAKWWGGVLADNGKIYCVPDMDEDILVIDPSTDTAYRITGAGSGSGTAKNRFYGGVLGSDGKIYCPPQITASTAPDDFLVIDPATDTYTYSMLGLTAYSTLETATSMMRCRWGVALDGGDRILFPRSENTGGYRLIDFDVTTGTAVKRAGGGISCSGGVLRPSDGLVYFTPFNASQILRFNPATNTFTTIAAGGLFGTGNTFEGAFVLNDGNVYFFCGNADYHIRVRGTSTVDQLVEHFSNGLNLTGNYYNNTSRWGRGAQTADGTVYLPPMGTGVWTINSSFDTTLLGGLNVPSRSGIYGPGTDFGFYLGEDLAAMVEGTQPNKWRHAVVADDGRIFAIPYNADDVMVIEPDPPAPREPIADAALIPAYGAGNAHGSRRPHDAAVTGDPLDLADAAVVLWDTRAWTGDARDVGATTVDLGDGHRALPNLGTGGQYFDLDVYTEPGIATWAQSRWQSGEMLKWTDFGGVSGEAPWTWMVALGTVPDGAQLELYCLAHIGNTNTTGLSFAVDRDDADSSNLFFAARAGAFYTGDSSVFNFDDVAHNRLFIVTEDYQAGGGIVGGGATAWAGYDNPLTRPGLTIPDGTWDVFGDPGNRVVLTASATEQYIYFHPFARSFLYIYGHLGSSPTPGQFWNPIRGMALVRQTPTDELLQAWQDYWFP